MLTKPEPTCLGKIVMTLGVRAWIEEEPHLEKQVSVRLQQFLDGDWGDTNYSEEDCEANRKTLQGKGGLLMASYLLLDGRKFWIMTSGYGQQSMGIDYCYTTVLLPSEY